MDLGLRNKNIIVTGGSRGIGRAIALEFAIEGANVAICARGKEALNATKADIAHQGVKVHTQACDVSDLQALSNFIKAAKEKFGQIDVLVNNPSAFSFSNDEAGWNAGWNVDVMASIRATLQVLPWMEAAGSGVVIHISSISGMEAGSPAPYAAVKAALISHSKTLAAELAPKGIRVNCVSPGSVEFPGGFWDHMKEQNQPMYEGILGSIPFGRLGKPEEIAAAVVFLASDKASWISGTNLVVDGSQHKGNL